MWRSDDEPGQVEIMLGSVDEDFLLEKSNGELGRLLCEPANGHFWCKNAVKGVTDVMPGKKYEEGSKSKPMAD